MTTEQILAIGIAGMSICVGIGFVVKVWRGDL